MAPGKWGKNALKLRFAENAFLFDPDTLLESKVPVV
jgi:hypothetical protein